MKNFIFNFIILSWFGKQIQEYVDRAIKVASWQQTERERNNRDNLRKSELHGHTVISVGEGSYLPVVGRVVNWVDSVPVVEDLVTNQKLICFGKTFHYTEQALRTLLKIPAQERYHLLVGRAYWTTPKMHSDTLESIDEEDLIRRANHTSQSDDAYANQRYDGQNNHYGLMKDYPNLYPENYRPQTYMQS